METKNFSDGYHVTIDSTDRLCGNESDFSVVLNIPKPASSDFNRVAVVDAVIPRTWLLIDAPLNTFILRETNTVGITQERTITITPGNFSIVSWCTHISRLMTAASLSMGHSFNYTATRGEFDNGLIVYSISNIPAAASAAIVMDEGMTDQVGFEQKSVNVFTQLPDSKASLTSTKVFNATGEYAIEIRSSLGQEGSDDVLCSMFAVTQTSPLGSIVYQGQHPRLQSKRFERGGNTYTVQVCLSTTGRILNLRGCNIAIHLKFWKQPDASVPERSLVVLERIQSSLVSVDSRLAELTATMKDLSITMDRMMKRLAEADDYVNVAS